MLHLILLSSLVVCVLAFLKSNAIAGQMVEIGKKKAQGRTIGEMFGMLHNPPFDDQIEVDKLKQAQYQLLLKVASVIIANICVAMFFL